MKNKIILLVIITMVFITSGCSKRNSDNHEESVYKKEDINEIKTKITCSRENTLFHSKQKIEYTYSLNEDNKVINFKKGEKYYSFDDDNDFNMICEGSLDEAENNTKIYDHLKETAECKKDLKEISIYDEYDILKIKSKNTIPDKYVYDYLTDEYILDIDNYKSFITSKGYNCVIE